MLLHEIEPFAEHHISELDKVREFLKFAQISGVYAGATISDDEILENLNRLIGIRNALVRFKACAIDEWKTKEKLETQVRDCRLNHK